MVLYAGSQRFRTQMDDRETRHSFSFGPHYDPANVGFGPMTALNDERLGPSAGYPEHGHADLEIVTWVVDGTLAHTDAEGTTMLHAGAVLAQSAGSGIRHSETAAGRPTRFVQTWLRPDVPGGVPSRAHVSTPETCVPQTGSALVPVVGPDGLRVGVAGARLLAGTLAAGEALRLPDVRRHHVFVAEGSLLVPGLSGVTATDGDALRLTDDCDLMVASVDSQVLVWSF